MSSDIPAELKLQIIDLLCQGSDFGQQEDRHRDVRTVSLLSEAWRAIAQPVLFKELELSMKDRVPYIRATGLLGLLTKRPETSTWIKTVLVFGDHFRRLHEEPDFYTDAWTRMIENLLSKLVHLRKLVLSDLVLLPQAMVDIISLPRLRDLTFISTLNESTSSNEIAEDVISQVQRFQFDCDFWEGCRRAALRLLSGPELKELLLPAEALSNIISATGGKTFDNLVTLAVGVPAKDWRYLVEFLASCPHLRHLNLDKSQALEGISDINVPSDIVPRLEYLSGPPVLAEVFVPGRPLSELVLGTPIRREGVINGPSFWKALTTSTSRITYAIMPTILWTPEVLWLVSESLPAVELLELNWFIADAELASCSFGRQSRHYHQLIRLAVG